MKVRQFLSASILWVLTMGLVAPDAVAGSSATYTLGNTTVTLNEFDVGGEGGFTFFAPHSNETTAVVAAKSVVKKSGGTVFWLTHSDGKRNITFKLGSKTYHVDPNRIFSDAGAKASLKSLGPYSDEALAAVRGLAQFVLEHIQGLHRPPVIGIHNNTDGGDLSAKAYLANHASEAKSVFVNPKLDADDFFFVTTSQAFGVLKAKGFNTVLQAWPLADDGSLSVYCERSGIPYINVEAQVGHLSQQTAMLKAATGTY